MGIEGMIYIMDIGPHGFSIFLSDDVLWLPLNNYRKFPPDQSNRLKY